jgi:16S rRNA (cytosine967-C5)-methyltransferase
LTGKMEAAQRMASAAVERVLNGASLDSVLSGLWRDRPTLPIQQRSLIQDLTYGALRFHGYLDALLAELLERPLHDQGLACLLRVALYQLEYTRAPAHTVVDQAVLACSRAGRTSAKSLVNGVLRNFLRRSADVRSQVRRLEVARYSFPQWWIDKLRQDYPEQYGVILQSANQRPPMTLRVNRRRMAPAEYIEMLHATGIGAEVLEGSAVVLDRPRPIAEVPGFAEGLVSVQDASAQRAASLLDLQAGQRVLDACAAPGGKTAHILETADVEVTAVDHDTARLDRLRDNLNRIGLRAEIVCGDAAELAVWWHRRPFQRILADEPCTGSGVVRRHPDIKWLRRPADVVQFAVMQARMLDALWRVLESGGKLLYATCSVFHEENHIQVGRFLDRHRDARRLPLAGDETHREQQAGQILPDERHDGFFYALLQKN